MKNKKKILLLLAASTLVLSCRQNSRSTEGKEPGIPVPDYVEVPQMKGNDPDCRIITHHASTYRTKQWLRNYTACYDVRRHNPLWVAYPLHDCYTEGGFTRPQRDPWRPDPSLTPDEQSTIYAVDWEKWPWKTSKGRPRDRFHYWSPSTEEFMSHQGYIKGHLLRSADRGAGNPEVLLDLNMQTFYPVNIAPERYEQVKTHLKARPDKKTLTLNHWTIVEGIAPDHWKCKDTLYMVAGCWYEDDSHKVIDASTYGDSSEKSKTCIVPTARYKVFLRTKAGNTGKKISECKAGELMAIAFWFPQCFRKSNLFDHLDPLRSYTMTVAELEKKLGGQIDFFPSVPAAVKRSFRVSDWPELDQIIDQALDENYSGDYIYF